MFKRAQLFLIRYALVAALGTVGIVILGNTFRALITPAHTPPGSPSWIRSVPTLHSWAMSTRKYLGTDSHRAGTPTCNVPAAATAQTCAVNDSPDPITLQAQTGRCSAVVISARTFVHNETGAAVGTIEPGQRLEVQRFLKGGSGTLALCRVTTPAGTGTNVLIRSENLSVVNPIPGQDEQKIIHTQIAVLNAKIEERRSALVDIEKNRNPYYRAYVQAVKAYKDFGVQIKDLESKAAETSSPDRTSILDQLRDLRFEGVRLEAELGEAQSKYRDWKHKYMDESLFDRDTEIVALRSEIERIQQRIESRQKQP